MHAEGTQGMDVSDFGGWDPSFTRRAITAAKPIGKRWFRWRVDGLEPFPRAVALWWCPITPEASSLRTP